MVVNAIEQDFDPLAAPLAQWADRYRGVGFDQFLVVEKPSSDAVDFRYRIFNADGREVEQCGNGARCFARFVADKGLTDKTEILVERPKGLLCRSCWITVWLPSIWVNRVSCRLKFRLCLHMVKMKMR